MVTCDLCGAVFRTESEELHHDCPVRYADHMNRASERLAEKGDRGRKEIDDARYWCRRCGAGYQKRVMLSRQGYCIGKECGSVAAVEWNTAISRAAAERS